MNSGMILKLIGVIASVVIIGLVTALTASSLSVGGVAYSSDSEACASCHIETLYVEGYRNSSHSNGDVSCMDCHKYSTPIKDEDCLSCHEDDYRTNSTKFLWDWVGFITPIDAHAENAHITQTCNNCHLEHKFQYGLPKAAVQSRCFECHIPIKDDVNLKDLPRAP